MKKFFSCKSFENFILLFFIPIYTWVLTWGQPLITGNMTLVANTMGRYYSLTIWGVFVGLACWFILDNKMRKTASRNILSYIFLMLSSFFFMVSSFTPYDLELYVKLSNLHVISAFLAPVLLMAAILKAVFNIYSHNKKIKCLIYITFGLAITAMYILIKTGYVNSLLEVFVTVSLCYVIRSLDYFSY